MLFALSALGAPLVVIQPSLTDDRFTLRTNDGGIDAWTFSSHYDPLVQSALRGRVTGRRIAFVAALVVGGGSILGGTAWQATRDGPGSIGPTLMVASGGALLLGAIPIAIYERHRTLLPYRHWSPEEAQLLASRTPITHGLTIVPTAAGWAVINRAGRPLSATEVAARIGDRNILRRARARAASSNLSAMFLIAGGYVAVIGGLDVASRSKLDITEDTRWTGIASMIAGTGLVVTGVITRSAQKRRQPQHFWDRGELQTLLDIP